MSGNILIEDCTIVGNVTERDGGGICVLGESEGIHHGTYRHDMWWWNARGYTPAGVEAWNCIRALDYLESRPEVDPERIGVTGRSGGGAYSWWIAALDDRIKVAVPVAGITDLENHVVDGTVEGHCDCMFMVNTYGWDYAQVAALVAPRPLLISNSDKDTIFPLEGVVRVHRLARKIYRLYDAQDRLGLQITEGPHRDTQELRVHAFHWFNRFLKEEDPLIERTAVKLFEPVELKVFDQLPKDEINTQIQESFTSVAPPATVPENIETWRRQRSEWREWLEQKSFRGWPQEGESLGVKEAFTSPQTKDLDSLGTTFQQLALPRMRQIQGLARKVSEPWWGKFSWMADQAKGLIDTAARPKGSGVRADYGY